MVHATKEKENSTVQVAPFINALRIKPLTADDLVNLPSRFQRNVLSTTEFAPNQVIVHGEKKQTWTFDKVFGPESSQKDIYEQTVKSMVDKFLEGFNVTILAYGQTSSGKTYTMGTSNEYSQLSETKGIIPRSMATLFSYVNSTQFKSRKFVIKVSFVEIYNEDLIDLLAEGDYESRPSVTIREDSKGNMIWSGLQEIKVNSIEEVMRHLMSGSMNRQVGATEMNSQSSRSHAIFSVTLSQQKFVTDFRTKKNEEEGDWVTVTSKFHFVDLAGSERLKRTSATGDRVKEGISINSGLLALGNVISALGDPAKAKNTMHIPYRDSKLTRLLQDSLGGNAKTLMIACVSPVEYNINETISTLKYANRARNIKNTAIVNQEETGWQDIEYLQTLVLKLRAEIKTLKNSDGLNSPISPNSPSFQSDAADLHQNYFGSETISNLTTDSTSEENKDIQVLEEQLIELQNLYNDMSKKYEQASASLNMCKNSDGTEKSLFTNGQNTIPNQEVLKSMTSNYENSIIEFEKELAAVREAVRNAEMLVREQEMKVLDAEDLNNQDVRLINDLKNNISNREERKKTTEEYIKDLEARLNARESEQKKDQDIINELRERLVHVQSAGDDTEKIVKNIELKLKESELNFQKINKNAQKLEKALHDACDAYLKLETRYKKDRANEEDDLNLFLEEIQDRDERISQLDKKAEELVEELEQMKRLKTEADRHSLKRRQSTSTFSSLTDLETPITSTPLGDYYTTSQLELQIYELQQIQERTMSEFLDIKQKYQYSLDKLSELNKQTRNRSSHRKSLSISNETIDELSNNALIQKLQTELRQLEMFHADKARGLDAVKQEFARLEINHLNTLEIVEELSEEIKRRDAMAQNEVMSVMNSDHIYFDSGDFSTVTSEIDKQEIINRLREEVEQLKEDQKKILDNLDTNQGGYKSDKVLEVEMKISEIKTEMSNVISEHSKKMAANPDDESLNATFSRLRELEELLIKAFEDKRKARVIDAISCLDADTHLQPELNDEMLEMRMQINKLDIEIESKSHTIAALLFPSIEQQNAIRKLEDELQEARESYQVIVEKKNKLNSISEESDTLEKQLKTLEEKMNNSEAQIAKAKESHHVPTPRRNSLMLLLDTPTHKAINSVGEKLSSLQKELATKLEATESLQEEQEIVIALQEQLEFLKTNIQQKNELIDHLKEDLEDKSSLQQRLREKEAEALSFRTKLMDIQNKIIYFQNEKNELGMWLQKLETGGDINKDIEIELRVLKKEIIHVREREAAALERLRVLKSSISTENEDTHLHEELENLRSVECAQQERINELERKIAEKGDSVDEEIVKVRTELAIVRKAQEKQSNVIETLEQKLKIAEDKSYVAAIKQEINDLKTRETENLKKIQSLESELRESTIQDMQQVDKLNEEIKKLRGHKREQRKQMEFLQNRLELAEDENPDILSLRSQISASKASEAELQKKVNDLEAKFATVQKEAKIFEMVKEEVAIKELSTMKGGSDLQKRLAISLEEEMKRLRRELELAKNDTNSSSEKYEELTNSLSTTHKQYEESLKRIKILEGEVESFENNGVASDEKVATVRTELVNAKLEIMAQNEMVISLDSQIVSVEKERDQNAQRAKELVNILDEREINQKDAIRALESTLTNFESKILEMKVEPDVNNETIVLMDEKLGVVRTQLKETKTIDEKRIKMLNGLENELKVLTKLVVSDEQEFMNQDYNTVNLNSIIQSLETELQMAHLSKTNSSARIRQLEALLAEANLKRECNATSSINLETLNAELQKAKETEVQYRQQVKSLKSKIRDAKQRRNAEHANLKDITNNIYSLRAQSTLMQNELDDIKYNSVLDCYDSIDDETVENIIKQLKQTHKVAKEKINRVIELEKISHQLESDKINQCEHNEDLEEELDQLQKDIETLADEFADAASKFEDSDKICKKQRRIIAELEVALEGAKNPINISELEGSTDPETNRLVVLNKELRQSHDQLNSKMSEVEKKANSLTNKIKSLETELVRLDENDHALTKNLEIQIKQLEFEKDKLQGTNEIILEEREILDKRITFLREQLRMDGTDETKTATQIIQLKEFVSSLNKQVSDIKQKSADKSKSMEQEISQLLKINAQLERETNQIDGSSPSNNSIGNKIINHDYTIAEQNDLIKSLQEKVNQLQMQSYDNFEGQDNYMPVKLKKKAMRTKLITTGYTRRPSEDSSRTPSPTIPPPRTPTTPRNISNISSDLSAEFQRLLKKASIIENETSESRKHVESLESNVAEGETNLSIAKDQLSILQKEKHEYMELIKSLSKQLNEAQMQIENAKYSVKEEQKVMENILDEERKAKVKAEKARLALETQMEQIMNKKRRFMCF
ncbi:7724_t:CDS:2 [Dentiscutata erythropus]|uniref:7724_t:CDS:1 n=1 Tax=Dentiscutata erythropus TaxID=1348616 RepID=A0A9N9B7Z6_9GLOM|nr:7724_t:CDS:2 [Dentiscutata erythropus]